MTVYSIPDSIPTGLQTDVSQPLGAFMNYLEAGDTVQIEHVYRTDATVELTGLNRVGIEWGADAAFVRVQPQTMRTASHLKLNHCHNMDLTAPKIQGTKPLGVGYRGSIEAQHGIEFSSSSDIRVSDVNVASVWGDQLNFSADRRDLKNWSKRVYVTGGQTGESGRHALGVTSAQDIRITGVKFGLCRTGLDLEPNGMQGGCVDITVQACEWQGHRGNWVASLDPNLGGAVVGVTLFNNHSLWAPLSIVVAGAEGTRRDFYVVNNTSNAGMGTNSGAAMNFVNVSGDLDIRDNVQPLNRNRVTGLPMRVARWNAYTQQNATITYEGNTPDADS